MIPKEGEDRSESARSASGNRVWLWMCPLYSWIAALALAFDQHWSFIPTGVLLFVSCIGLIAFFGVIWAICLSVVVRDFLPLLVVDIGPRPRFPRCGGASDSPPQLEVLHELNRDLSEIIRVEVFGHAG
jgi:hypothetical protein